MMRQLASSGELYGVKSPITDQPYDTIRFESGSFIHIELEDENNDIASKVHWFQYDFMLYDAVEEEPKQVRSEELDDFLNGFHII